MKWDRAVHHVESLATSCADMATKPATIFPLRVRQLWAVGAILEAPRELDAVTVALVVDLPAQDVAWWAEPPGAQHWANATRLNKNPVVAWWRSTHAPIWNHRIERPALVWDDTSGLQQTTIEALRDGHGDTVRSAAPTEDQRTARLRDELRVSLHRLRACTTTYDDKRWRPGKLEPVADALWQASDGYLDVLDAVNSPRDQ